MLLRCRAWDKNSNVGFWGSALQKKSQREEVKQDKECKQEGGKGQTLVGCGGAAPVG